MSTSSRTDAVSTIHSYFYHYPCPLCQQDVDISQPDFYRVLPLDSEKLAFFNKKPFLDRYDTVRVGDVEANWMQKFPYLGYAKKIWLLHTRCLGLVDLPLPKLYLLLDVVEPTTESHSNPPRSQHGAFYTQPILEEYPAVSAPNVSFMEQFIMNLRAAVCALLRFIVPPKKQQMVKKPSLPAEIWNQVFQYDVGHLLFLMRAASQLSRLDTVQQSIPNLRFAVEELDLPYSLLQIHTTSIGGRTYISNVSDASSNNHTTQVTSTRSYDLTGSNYLAVKGDGIGIVDIAFEQQQDGQPSWSFGNSTQPFSMELCQIKDANLQSLRIIRDALKCRAITTSNRGPEAYIHGPPFPPSDSWVTLGFLIESKLSEVGGPFTHFIPATYIPFAGLKRISFLLVPENGIIKIDTNYSKPGPGEDTHTSALGRKQDDYFVSFSEPPTTLKFLVCFSFDCYYPIIQFKINGEWVPKLSPLYRVSREILVENAVVENALGLWMGKTFDFIPAQIGMVISKPTDVSDS